jgi:hypothetical protein
METIEDSVNGGLERFRGPQRVLKRSRRRMKKARASDVVDFSASAPGAMPTDAARAAI